MEPNGSKYIAGVDIGGTFTDCVVLDETGKITIGKALSTPDDFAQGAIDAIEDAALNLGLASAAEILRDTRLFFHACTIGDNTLITRAGAKTGLITTKGFADTMLMMRGKYHRWPDRRRSRPPRRPDQAGTIGSAPPHRRSAGAHRL